MLPVAVWLVSPIKGIPEESNKAGVSHTIQFIVSTIQALSSSNFPPHLLHYCATATHIYF